MTRPDVPDSTRLSSHAPFAAARVHVYLSVMIVVAAQTELPALICA